MAKMPCSAMLAMMFLSAKVCSAQPVDGENLWGESTAPPSIVPPASVTLCPVMSQIQSGTYLQTEPWSFMRTINVRQRAEIYNVGASATPAPSTPDTLLTPTAAPTDIVVGTITAVPFSWGIEYELRKADHDKPIAKIVNPSVFWDKTQEIYSCDGALLGSVAYKFSWKTAWADRYVEHQVRDASGSHVATLAEDQKKTTGFLGAHQYSLYIKDLSNNPLASMRHQRGGSFWTQKLDVAIEVLSENVMAPPPAMEPEFLALVFANALAMDCKYGPYWGLIVGFGTFILFFCLLCCAHGCFCTGATEGAAEPEEEKEGLLKTKEGKTVEGGSANKSIFDCCSRKVAPVQSNMNTASAKGATASATASAKGGH